jgi:hypothetical protein
MYAVVAFLGSNDEPHGGLAFYDFDDAEAQMIAWMLDDNKAGIAGHFYYRFVNLNHLSVKPKTYPEASRVSPLEAFGRAMAGMGLAENDL